MLRCAIPTDEAHLLAASFESTRSVQNALIVGAGDKPDKEIHQQRADLNIYILPVDPKVTRMRHY
jgi:hypothetical protein